MSLGPDKSYEKYKKLGTISEKSQNDSSKFYLFDKNQLMFPVVGGYMENAVYQVKLLDHQQNVQQIHMYDDYDYDQEEVFKLETNFVGVFNDHDVPTDDDLSD